LAIAGLAAFAALATVGILAISSSHVPMANVTAAVKGPLPEAAANPTLGPPAATPSRSSSKAVSAATRPVAVASSLPPPGTPLAQIYDELKARADAGDAAAASRLYRDVHRCEVARSYRRMIANQAPFLLDREKPATLSLEMQDEWLKRLQRFMNYVQANAATCAGADDTQLVLYPVAMQAARLGDVKAGICYIGMPMTSISGLLDHPEWLGQFKASAPSLIETAIHQGDWNAVELAQSAYSGANDGSLLSQLFVPSPVMNYRYLRRKRLGASGEFAAELDRMLAAAPLGATQKADADAWARDTYVRYYNGTASYQLVEGANICPIADD
jgi:hypothetical protein